MANELDEVSGPTNSAGRDVKVIDKQLQVSVGAGTQLLEPAIWIVGVLGFGAIGFAVKQDFLAVIVGVLIGLLPGIFFAVSKKNTEAYFRQLQQKIQADASQIDNYLENRVVILQNLAALINKSVELDKDVMKTVAAYRGGVSPQSDAERNRVSSEIEAAFTRVNVAFEAYPDLKSQDNIAEAMRQNTYLQREITAARTLYNDTLTSWNAQIYAWPIKQLVASKAGYTTRIPFTAAAETKAAARGTFF